MKTDEALLNTVKPVVFSYLAGNNIDDIDSDFLEGSVELLSELFNQMIYRGTRDQDKIDNITMCYGVINRILQQRKLK